MKRINTKQANEIISFTRQKDYKFKEEISEGGLGLTVLLQDDLIDELFVCKKYSPLYPEHKEHYFNNFIQEIKILFNLHHNNIVRVFNYYLYPEIFTGYILMEYIQGYTIDEYVKINPDRILNIFNQTVEGFRYLQLNNILHRDIRPANILVNKEGIVKIIDFGFGKKIESKVDYDKSVSLNWCYNKPDEFKDGIYDFRTEVYFISKLFEEIAHENKIENDSFYSILNKMGTSYNKRISSFNEVERLLIPQSANFESNEKNTYRTFATTLEDLFYSIYESSTYNTDTDSMISTLEIIYHNSQLEEFVQNPKLIAEVFVNGRFKYNKKKKMSVFTLFEFCKLFKSKAPAQRKIILNNLWIRLDKIERYSEFLF